MCNWATMMFSKIDRTLKPAIMEKKIILLKKLKKITNNYITEKKKKIGSWDETEGETTKYLFKCLQNPKTMYHRPDGRSEISKG